MRSEIQTLLINTEDELRRLGDERVTHEQQRLYLIQISMAFYELCRAALSGGYDGVHSSFFTVSDGQPGHRLRASIHAKNTAFALWMRDSAARRKVSNAVSEEEFDEDFDAPSESDLNASVGQMQVSKKEMQEWVKSVSPRRVCRITADKQDLPRDSRS